LDTHVSAPPVTTPLQVTTPPFSGLTSAEVAERVRRGETNRFKARVGRSYWQILRDNLFNAFTVVMLTMLFIVLLMGDYATVVFAGFAVVTNALFGIVQESYSKRKFDRLMAMSAPMVRVYRDGALSEVSVYDVVKDDVIPLEPGDKIIADGHVLDSDALEVDESQLTGESDAVLKDVGSPVSSGSFCVAGSGVMTAEIVGEHSTVNRLTSVAKAYRYVLTPTQGRIYTIVQISIFIMLVCTPMIFIAGVIQRGILIHLENFQNAVVFVASIVPQGLVLTATLSLTIGAIVISRRQTLVQRVNAVESMGNVTCLCFDKTGTLTQNRLVVSELQARNISDADLKAKLALYLGNLSTLNRTAGAVADYLSLKKGSAPAQVKQREVPFNSARKWSAVIINNETLIMGAPERLLHESEYDLAAQSSTLAEQGYRVLAFSHVPFALDGDQLPDERRALALIILSDTVRPDIKETLDAFREQGVALKVISGDNLETVSAVAREAGMTINHAYTGDQLMAMSEGEFAEAARLGDLFARIEPNTKRQLVAALKKAGHYVAMTGDGVNDVPSLKEAHLAIAMNDGAQMTKDIADIVLLNNALTTLPEAFHEGRTITQIIFGTCKIFLIKNLYSLLFFVFVGFMFLPFPVTPIQISWVTFGVVNLTAGLMSFRLYKPAPMHNFREDVLDYVVTGGSLGTVAACLVYAVAFFANGEDVIATRSLIVIFLTLFGMLVFWNVCGINLMQFNTILPRLRVFLFGLGAAVMTITVCYLLPGVLSFEGPSTLEWVFVGTVFATMIILLNAAMRTRYFSKLIWRISAPP